jgi:hypothetical protein
MPPSGNGASSLHLIWETKHQTHAAVRATLEIVEPPISPDLYFFALQATFTDSGKDRGGAHVGLQWNLRHPGSTAVNWGGYLSQHLGGSVLPGTDSELPSRPSDPNTRDYPWKPHRPYRLTIEPGYVPGWWLGTVTDLISGETTPVRELEGGGRRLRAPMVWTEAFAPCEGPPVEVRWSNLETAREPGQWERVDTVRTNYQAYSAGGCTNTDLGVVGAQFFQRTATERLTEHGRLITVDR